MSLTLYTVREMNKVIEANPEWVFIASCGASEGRRMEAAWTRMIKICGGKSSFFGTGVVLFLISGHYF